MKSAGEMAPWAKARSQAPSNPWGLRVANPKVDRAMWPTEERAMMALMSPVRITERADRRRLVKPILMINGVNTALRFAIASDSTCECA